MKKQTWLIPLTLICIISVSINIFLVVSYNNSKNLFVFDIFSHLINISKCLDNIANTVSNDDLDYTLSALEKECIQLDSAINGLCTLSSVDLPVNNYEDFSKKTISSIKLNINNYSGEEVTKDINLHKEDIEELIKMLSPNNEINYDYPNSSATPNYSLSVKRVISLIIKHTPN